MNTMTDQEQSNTQSSAILKELSDIKATLAVNTTETVNIKGSLTEMKVDIKEIKADNVNRREFNDGMKVLREEKNSEIKVLKDEINSLKKWRDTLMYAVILAVLYGVLELVIK